MVITYFSDSWTLFYDWTCNFSSKPNPCIIKDKGKDIFEGGGGRGREG